MNRHQRRAALKAQGSVTDGKERPQRPAAIEAPAPQSRPGLALRLVSAILLSSWVLRRVKNPEVLGMLLEVARQAGRDDIVRKLGERLNDSSADRR